ncbi:hypothetical protein EVAR_53015_1 [Eumeta japonica]|uniref:Uncharacterized protein n=1 Tax=Eumeta variegata TaxID=151549 RepID=A0A4C1XKT8_EUMVA|nr:hypothetical protein EVAR_53015_1 [Eumeta japonica]
MYYFKLTQALQLYVVRTNMLILAYFQIAKRFFDIAGSHPNALLRAAVDYQPPHPTHLIRRPRNVLTDSPDALTAAVESLNDVNDTHD